MTPPPLMHVVDVCEDNLGVLAWIWTDPLTRFRFLLPIRLLAPFDRMMVFLPTSLFVGDRPASSMSDCLAMHNKPRTFRAPFAAWPVAILASREIIGVTISVVRSSLRFFSRFFNFTCRCHTHDDVTISRHFRFFAILSDGPFFSTQKVFSLPASALDFDALQFLGFH